jgi:glycosyltransferase involved in cell wall biosynthesis
MSAPTPLRVAVITPYLREPLAILRYCHQSVLRQTHPCAHFMVADGHPLDEVSRWSVKHLSLPGPHHDVGNTARGLGALSAMNQGYDAVAFLDADNWYYPDHIESMVDLHRRTGAAVCTATRNIHRQDGSLMFTDNNECNGITHVDTSCYFVTRAAFELLPIWLMMPGQLGPVGDRVFWRSIVARRIPHAHFSRSTVAFRTRYEAHYASLGEPAPPGAKSNEASTGQANRWWRSLTQDVRSRWLRYFESSPSAPPNSSPAQEPGPPDPAVNPFAVSVGSSGISDVVAGSGRLKEP